MKTILIIICLTCFKTMATAQFYYGGNIGVSIGKSYDTKTKQIRNGINDAYLSIPIGYVGKYWIAEISPQGSASLQTSVSFLVGGKLDFGDNAGLHLLIGYKDEILYNPKPLQLTHYFYPSGRLRIWLGNFMVQGSFIKKKQNSEFEFGVGCIGLWEKIN